MNLSSPVASQVKLLYPITQRHTIMVFPARGSYMGELYRSYKLVELSVPYITVTTEADFDHAALASPENVIYFWKYLPPWLPMKTKATIALIFMGQVIQKDVSPSSYHPSEHAYWNEFMKYACRPDIIICQSSAQQHDLVRRNIFSYIHSMPIFQYQETVYGRPEKFMRSPAPDFYMIGYGKLDGRREKMAEWLKEKYGSKFAWFPYLRMDERVKLFANTKVVLYLRKSAMGQRFPSQLFPHVVPGSAAIFTDYMDHSPLNFDSGELCLFSSTHEDELLKDIFLSWIEAMGIRNMSIYENSYSVRAQRNITRFKGNIDQFLEVPGHL